MRGLTELEAAVRAAFDARLDRDSRRPIAVAFSGGGDSLALLLIADEWAREHHRDLVVLHVDHGLRAESRAWAATCGEVAARLARPFEVLPWTGDKPTTGLPAAARAARHALLAEAARRHGAAVIVMGHTADDRAEGAAMREAGSTTPDPRAWTPSPAWPEGRGVFLLRPLLGARRADLRAWLQARGETWIDDPANADTRFARVRARMAGPAQPPPGPEREPVRLAGQVREEAGVLTAARDIFRDPQGARLLAMACVCAGGGSRLPGRARVERLLSAVRAEGPVTATLAGARIEAQGRDIRIFRETGEWRRGGQRVADGVWDGRWELVGEAAQAPETTTLPARIRRTLPDRGAVSLVGARLRAAAGLIEREPA